MTRRRMPWLIVCAALLYAPCLVNGFTNWDDPLITQNAHLADASLKGLAAIFLDTKDRIYTPLVSLTFWIQMRLFGGRPAPMHAVNLAVHLLNVVLVYALIARLTGKDRVAFFTALFFAIHPMLAESVVWISARKDLLVAFFSLNAMRSYAVFAERGDAKSRRLSFMFFLLALLSKPSGVVLPLSLMLIDIWFGRRTLRELVRQKLDFLAVALLHGAASTSFFLYYSPAGMLSDRGAFALAGNMARSAWFYAGKLVWPSGLSALYPNEFPVSVVWGCALAALVAVGAFKNRKAGARYWVMPGLFLVNLFPALPLSAFTDLYAVADRYVYLASIGLFWVWADVVDGLINLRVSLVWVLVAVQAVGLSFVTHQRLGAWKDSVSLWSDVVLKYPDSVPAGYVNLGTAYGMRGELDRAIAMHTRAVALAPSLPYAYHNRANARIQKKEWAPALADLNKAIELKPDYAEAYASRSVVHAKQGRLSDALVDLDAALFLRPDFSDAEDLRAKLMANARRLSQK